MRNKLSSLFTVVGLLLLLAALALAVYNVLDNRRAMKASGEAGAALSQTIVETVENKTAEELGPEILPDYVNHPDVEMPTKEIDGKLYIGMLKAPSVNLELPVLSEYTQADLEIAPCRYYGSAYKDDMVITAHNYPSHFGPLRELQLGDEIIFTDVDGNEFHYIVERFQTLRSTDVEEVKNSGYDLSLFTCTIGGYTRYTIRCELKK